MASPQGQILKLIGYEEKLLEEFNATVPKEEALLSLLRDLRSERQLEFQIYSSREQWFWIPWTVLLAGTLAAITAANPVTGVVVPPFTFACAFGFCLLRRHGLDESLRALEQRHKWTYWLTQSSSAPPSVRMFDFGFRAQDDLADDPRHKRGFSYPVKMRWVTCLVWMSVWVAGSVKFWNSAESHPLKKWLGWA
jgi:hypothetical protein